MTVTLGLLEDDTSTGWTTITASAPSGEGSGFSGAGTRKVYVDSAAANDSGDGSQATPKKTIAAGFALLRDGHADWLLLKKGGTWSEHIGNLGKSGLSASEPMVITSYGTGARPLINVDPSISATFILSSGNDGTGNYFAIIGLEVYAYTRDPSSGSYNSGTVANDLRAIFHLNHINWFLIEDCKFTFLSECMSIHYPDGTNDTLILRRNVIAQSTAGMGLYVGKTATPVIDENTFDHNGWNETIPGSGPNVFNHNIYHSEDNVGPITVRGNILARDASGSQFRTGMTVTNNLFLNSPYGHNIGMPFSGVSTVSNNVHIGQLDLTSNGTTVFAFPTIATFSQYLDVAYNVGTASITGNILTHKGSIPGLGGGGIAIDAGQNGSSATNNIIYSWEAPTVDVRVGGILSFSNLVGGSGGANATYSNVSLTGGSGTGATANIIVSGGAVTAVTVATNGGVLTYAGGRDYVVGDTLTASPGSVSGFSIKVASVTSNTTSGNTVDGSGYPDATRTVDTYDATLGGPGTAAHFLSLAALQSKDNWDSRLTANAVNTYIRAGFGLGTRIGGLRFGLHS